MTRQTSTPEELAQAFDYDQDIDDIPDEIWNAMVYIDDNTGLLDDYNDGIARLTGGGQKIQWYSRDRYFSNHNDLLQWVQMESPDIMLGTIGVRSHPKTGEPTAYAQISPISRWGYGDE